ncbi:MAG: CvpA family protein, partial [Oscillospiraceae bacterium]|nr:CvpA family protein [Oscillospiraceae bacterium]
MEFKYDPSKGGFQFNVGTAGNKPPREKKPRKAIGSKGARIAVNLGVTLLLGFIYYYVSLPALNFKAEEFYWFIFMLCLVYCICAMLTSGFQGTGAKGYLDFVKKQCRIPLFLVAALIVTALIGGIS